MRDPVLVTGFIIGVIASLIPIFSTDIYPFVDYPVHLTLIQLTGGDSTLPVNASDFETNWFTPYSGTFLAGKALNTILPLEQTGRALLMFYLIMTPIAFLFLLHAAGRDPRYALLMFPLLFNFNMAWGFLPFLISIPVLLTVLALALKAAGGAPRFVIALSFAMIILFFTHLFSFMIGTVFTGLILTAGSQTLLEKIKTLVMVFLIPGVLSLIWYGGLTYSVSDEYFISRAFRTFPLSIKLKFFPDFVISGSAGPEYRRIFWMLMVTCLLYLVSGFRRKRPGGSTGSISGPAIISAGFVLIYLICPYSLLTAVWLPNRLAFLAAAGVVIWLPVYRSRIRIVLDAGVILLTGLLAYHTTGLYGRFTREIAPAMRCLEYAESGKSLRLLLLDPRSSVTDHVPFGHMDQYYPIRRDGAVHNPFCTLTHMPVRYTPDAMDREAGFRPEIQRTETGLVADIRFDSYDYFLIRFASAGPGEDIRPAVIALLFKENAPRIRTVVQFDRWELFEKMEDSNISAEAAQ